MEARAQRPLVTARNAVEPAIAVIGIFQRKPEAGAAQRGGVQEGGILMAVHFSADMRRLEDVHGLGQQRVPDPKIAGDMPKPRIMRKGGKDRIDIVQGVADLVQGIVLALDEIALLIERLLFEEEADLVAGGAEIVVASMGLGGGGKDRRGRIRIELTHERRNALAQRIAGSRGNEILQQQKSIFPVSRNHLRHETAVDHRLEAPCLHVVLPESAPVPEV